MRYTGQITTQIKDMTGWLGSWLAQGSIALLPQILWSDEQVLDAMAGWYKSGTVLAVGTDKRLMLIDKKPFHHKVEEFLYDKITAVEYDPGVVVGRVRIKVSGDVREIKSLDYRRVPKFADFVTSKIFKEEDEEKDKSHLLASQESVKLLERLGQMYDQGLLSYNEFLRQKRKIIKT